VDKEPDRRGRLLSLTSVGRRLLKNLAGRSSGAGVAGAHRSFADDRVRVPWRSDDAGAEADQVVDVPGGGASAAVVAGVQW
jgi:hypothetical protein